MMFDPTIFDNLKVVFEGAMYDMDLSGELQIVNRTDRVELSAMSRSFGMEAVRKPDGAVKGSFFLKASLADLSAELLAEQGKQPGCSLELEFVYPIQEPARDCEEAEAILRSIWGEAPSILQVVQTVYGQEPSVRTNHVTVQFSRKLDERQIDDIPSLLEHLALSMERLERQGNAASR
ncbi:hypothetical protein N0M98_13245 [Paenibacillus doosanensis]|uniref:Uncharacterized protein n=1 Tax=Paenibacillus konkukensis TaxID=2020716 RepID=A0ABY4RGN2_9BACL|nr:MULTISPECIES: hypothetical protein [Paenibacillus]MCS7461113.1 hypothetical protein [Paenibacillus doosanensis]UQZ81609.1 hypothetical protein SK3146_00765 [Paenibacillus konkukensis]